MANPGPFGAIGIDLGPSLDEWLKTEPMAAPTTVEDALEQPRLALMAVADLGRSVHDDMKGADKWDIKMKMSDTFERIVHEARDKIEAEYAAALNAAQTSTGKPYLGRLELWEAYEKTKAAEERHADQVARWNEGYERMRKHVYDHRD